MVNVERVPTPKPDTSGISDECWLVLRCFPLGGSTFWSPSWNGSEAAAKDDARDYAPADCLATRVVHITGLEKDDE